MTSFFDKCTDTLVHTWA